MDSVQLTDPPGNSELNVGANAAVTNDTVDNKTASVTTELCSKPKRLWAYMGVDMDDDLEAKPRHTIIEIPLESGKVDTSGRPYAEPTSYSKAASTSKTSLPPGATYPVIAASGQTATKRAEGASSQARSVPKQRQAETNAAGVKHHGQASAPRRCENKGRVPLTEWHRRQQATTGDTVETHFLTCGVNLTQLLNAHLVHVGVSKFIGTVAAARLSAVRAVKPIDARDVPDKSTWGTVHGTSTTLIRVMQIAKQHGHQTFDDFKPLQNFASDILARSVAAEEEEQRNSFFPLMAECEEMVGQDEDDEDIPVPVRNNGRKEPEADSDEALLDTIIANRKVEQEVDALNVGVGGPDELKPLTVACDTCGAEMPLNKLRAHRLQHELTVARGKSGAPPKVPVVAATSPAPADAPPPKLESLWSERTRELANHAGADRRVNTHIAFDSMSNCGVYVLGLLSNVELPNFNGAAFKRAAAKFNNDNDSIKLAPFLTFLVGCNVPVTMIHNSRNLHMAELIKQRVARQSMKTEDTVADLDAARRSLEAKFVSWDEASDAEPSMWAPRPLPWQTLERDSFCQFETRTRGRQLLSESTAWDKLVIAESESYHNLTRLEVSDIDLRICHQYGETVEMPDWSVLIEDTSEGFHASLITTAKHLRKIEMAKFKFQAECSSFLEQGGCCMSVLRNSIINTATDGKLVATMLAGGMNRKLHEALAQIPSPDRPEPFPTSEEPFSYPLTSYHRLSAGCNTGALTRFGKAVAWMSKSVRQRLAATAWDGLNSSAGLTQLRISVKPLGFRPVCGGNFRAAEDTHLSPLLNPLLVKHATPPTANPERFVQSAACIMADACKAGIINEATVKPEDLAILQHALECDSANRAHLLNTVQFDDLYQPRMFAKVALTGLEARDKLPDWRTVKKMADLPVHGKPMTCVKSGCNRPTTKRGDVCSSCLNKQRCTVKVNRGFDPTPGSTGLTCNLWLTNGKCLLHDSKPGQFDTARAFVLSMERGVHHLSETFTLPFSYTDRQIVAVKDRGLGQMAGSTYEVNKMKPQAEKRGAMCVGPVFPSVPLVTSRDPETWLNAAKNRVFSAMPTNPDTGLPIAPEERVWSEYVRYNDACFYNNGNEPALAATLKIGGLPLVGSSAWLPSFERWVSKFPRGKQNHYRTAYARYCSHGLRKQDFIMTALLKTEKLQAKGGAAVPTHLPEMSFAYPQSTQAPFDLWKGPANVAVGTRCDSALVTARVLMHLATGVVNALSGPNCTAFQKTMSRMLTDECMLTATCGRDNFAVAKYFSQPEIARRCYFWNTDFTLFDLSHHEKAKREFFRHMFKTRHYSGTVLGKIVEERCKGDTIQYERGQFRGKRPHGLCSGTCETYAENTFLSMSFLSFAFLTVYARRHNMTLAMAKLHSGFRMIASGDDGVLSFNVDPEPYREEFLKMTRQGGFALKLETCHHVSEVKFLGGSPISCGTTARTATGEINNRSARVMVPIPQRFCTNLGWTLSRPADTNAFYSGICRAWQNTIGCMPVYQHLLSFTAAQNEAAAVESHRLVVCEMARRCEDKLGDNRTRSFINSQTWTDVARAWGITAEQLARFDRLASERLPKNGSCLQYMGHEFAALVCPGVG